MSVSPAKAGMRPVQTDIREGPIAAIAADCKVHSKPDHFPVLVLSRSRLCNGSYHCFGTCCLFLGGVASGQTMALR